MSFIGFTKLPIQSSSVSAGARAVSKFGAKFVNKDYSLNDSRLITTILNNLFLFSSRYRCDNSRCILWSSVCDKVSDCSDGSDESPRACAAATGSCSKSENFRCNNGNYYRSK